MKISKTRFTNFLRCPNYVALAEIHDKKERAVVSLSDEEEIEVLMGLENMAKKAAIYDSMFESNGNEDEEDEDITVKPTDPQTETLMPYYRKIEELTAIKITELFGGDIIYDEDTRKQKMLKANINGYEYYCFLDGFQEDNKTIRIIESKATTSKKFKKLTFNTIEKEKTTIFIDNFDEILVIDERFLLDKAFLGQTHKLFNRFSDVGRYVYDLAYQRKIFEKSNLNTKDKNTKYYLAVLNDDYIHDGKTDDNGNTIYSSDVIKLIDLTEITNKMMVTLELDMERVSDYLDEMDANLDHIRIDKYCQRKDMRECNFYPFCSKKVKKIPDHNSIFTYIGNHHGFDKRNRFDLISEGYVSALDIPYEWLTRPNNIIQRDVMERKKPYYDIDKIRTAINSLKFPLYHLDFESFPCPLPRLKGEKPYSQSLFQFSIHIERKPFDCDKELDNYSFLADNTNDPREDLVKEMIKVIKPDGGSIIVYNQSFEKTRIKELGELFPKYQERLNDISNRLVDLMYFLKGNENFFTDLGFPGKSVLNYYHDGLNGSFSIKKVLPLFTDLTYKGLEVGNGTEALTTYARFPGMQESEFKRLYKALIEYCKQDTWAMVEILWGLRKEVL